jgi:hypothetical protein
MRYPRVVARVAVAAFVTFSGPAQAGSDCGIDRDRLGVRYTVSDRVNGESRNFHMQVWRHGNQVAYVHEERELTEIWDLVSDGRQKLIRYFDGYGRAIEYQPEDVETGSGQDAWSRRYQVVADSELEAMEVVRRTGSGCDATEVYESARAAAPEGMTMIRWRPALNLAEEIRGGQGDSAIRWRVDEIYTDAARVDEEFTKRHRYHMTDFVDIGDNESDPFLRKMISLGFIEHRDH